jgi:hypothetical protein
MLLGPQPAAQAAVTCIASLSSLSVLRLRFLHVDVRVQLLEKKLGTSKVAIG